jgi:hypothetical protein
MSTLKTTNLQHASAASPAIVLASDGTATAQLSSLNGGALSGARNRIINGDMRLDQRNAGAASANTINGYFLDRWIVNQSTTGKIIAQQNAGSVTPPSGFSNYLGVTSQSAYSISSTDNYHIAQFIEGFNFSDFGWGAAGAKSITISFWVRSSLTGTFGGALTNSLLDRAYPFSYSISAANTWEQKTITVAGDTSGTWVGSTNGIGLRLYFGLGVGSTYSGTAGSWSGNLYVSATGATSVVGTNGATFYITGVQLEPGSVATPFERRSYGQELALCQRYFEKSYDTDDAPGTSTYLGVNTNGGLTNMAAANYATRGGSTFKVTKRAQPTVVTYDSAGNNGKCNYPDSTTNQSFTVIHRGLQGFTAETSTLSNGTDTRCYWHWTANSEL